jgi:hypothetical protein
MSRTLLSFTRGQVNLPYDVTEIIEAWEHLRGTMIRKMPEAFSREEWAYLITFLESDQLWRVFEQAFGLRCDAADSGSCLYHPRGTVAVWLPNNVSLLGPLVMILLSLTGNKLRFKAGSRSEDLCGALIEFVEGIESATVLHKYLADYVKRGVFDQRDDRNTEMARDAQVRIVFGSDAAAEGVETLPHPIHSLSIPFTDKRSQVWVDVDAVTEDMLESLVKVFLIYGQAGCTSPSRVVLLDADDAAVEDFRVRLVKAWPRAVKRLTEPHVASENIMAHQWASGLGWRAELAAGAAAVIAVGSDELESIQSPLFLPITGSSREAAIEQLPANIQTIGHAFSSQPSDELLGQLALRGVKRLVPLAGMHHFGPVWDGYDFWSQLFECMEVVR